MLMDRQMVGRQPSQPLAQLIQAAALAIANAPSPWRQADKAMAAFLFVLQRLRRQAIIRGRPASCAWPRSPVRARRVQLGQEKSSALRSPPARRRQAAQSVNAGLSSASLTVTLVSMAVRAQVRHIPGKSLPRVHQAPGQAATTPWDPAPRNTHFAPFNRRWHQTSAPACIRGNL